MKWISGANIGLKSFVVLRMAVATVLLCPQAVIYFENGSRNQAFYLVLVVASVYLLSLLYLLLHPFFRRHPDLLNGIQIAFDISLTSAVVYITGARSSPFIFLYALIVVFTGMIFSRTASYVAAAASGALYLLMVIYQFYQEFPSASAGSTFSQLALGEGGLEYAYFNLAGFLLMAMLSGYLSNRIVITGKELGESKKSFSVLKSLHENILQSLTTGVITTDIQGKLISVNKMSLEILGIDGEDKMLGNEITCLMPDLRVEELASKRRAEIAYLRPDGRELILGFSSSALRDTEGEMQGYIMVFQDLTKVKELEGRVEISRKMALLGQLGAGLAHEIRNPLSAISGAIEILSSEVEPSQENIQLLRIASDHIQRVNLIVEDFLLLTRPIKKPEMPINISLTIGETVESFLNATRRGGLQVVVDVEKELYVQADSQRLKQVIWNLLLNAMESMPDGGQITVRANLEAENVIIKVSDEGCGIKESLIAKVFEPFFTTREVGTGLGLTIVYKVVESYNGKVDVVSSENEGTTFTITLPEAEFSGKQFSYLHKTKFHDKLQL